VGLGLHYLLTIGIGLLALWPSRVPAVTLAEGEVIVSGSGAAGTGLLRIDPVTGAQTLIAPGSFGDFSLLGRDTIYALSDGAVVAVDTATGSFHVVSSGGAFVSPSGIAGDDFGRLFVSDYGAQGGDGAIFEIDPSTGAQTVLTSGGFLASNTLDSGTDLEVTPAGDLILLDPGPIGTHGGDVWRIDANSGASTSLFDDPLELFAIGTTGLGIAANGDIYVSNGMFFNTDVLKIDGITRDTTTVGGITVLATVPFDLPGTDIAILGEGTGFMSSETHGLYRWDMNPVGDATGAGLSAGTFNEVKLVVPEPATAASCALGLLALALRARSSRRR